MGCEVACATGYRRESDTFLTRNAFDAVQDSAEAVVGREQTVEMTSGAGHDR